MSAYNHVTDRVIASAASLAASRAPVGKFDLQVFNKKDLGGRLGRRRSPGPSPGPALDSTLDSRAGPGLGLDSVVVVVVVAGEDGVRMRVVVYGVVVMCGVCGVCV